MKKMITTGFMTLVTGLVSLALHAEDYKYLYWMVDETHDADKYEFTYATVKADDSSYLHLYNQSGDTGADRFYISDYATADLGLATSAGFAGLGTDSYIGSTFLFELWRENDDGDDDTLVAWKSVAYSALAGNIFANTQTDSGESPFVVSNVIPEPTSGMLLLIGIAGLAIRRRRGNKEVNL